MTTVILSIALVVLVAVVVWLLIDRSRRMTHLAVAERDRDVGARELDDLRGELEQRRMHFDEARRRIEELQLGLKEEEGRRQADRQRHAEHQQVWETARKEQAEQLESMQKQLREAFDALAGRALKANNDAFLELAKTAFAKEQETARGELTKKEQAVKSMVEPIRESLKRYEEKLTAMDKHRQATDVELRSQLDQVGKLLQMSRDETGRLVQALRTPHVRGRWGELTLKRVVELAGMTEHCDFAEQVSMSNEGARLRPDLIVHMPGDRELIVDAKTPLESYIAAIEAEDEDQRRNCLVAHARHVATHIDQLASKDYTKQFERAPQYVVLFIPGDQFLSAALRVQPDLIERGAGRGVLLATPATLIALLKAVAYGWQQQTLAENAREIQKLATTLHERLAIMTGHLQKVGKGLKSSVDSYNQLVGSVDRRLMPAVTQLEAYGGASRKELAAAEEIDVVPRDAEADGE